MKDYSISITDQTQACPRPIDRIQYRGVTANNTKPRIKKDNYDTVSFSRHLGYSKC